jgi:Tol biopolymer transport system component
MAILFGMTACGDGGGQSVFGNAKAGIFPDYTDVTVPPNIAPLNFSIAAGRQAVGRFKGEGFEFEISSDRQGGFVIPADKWENLLKMSQGGSFEVFITLRDKAGDKGQSSNPKENSAGSNGNGNSSNSDNSDNADGISAEYFSFRIYVAREPMDSYIAYRLIEPGYALWNRMGIYQRELGSYKQSVVYENKMTDNNCVNCHSFAARNPDKMLFHLRAKHAGTVIIDGDDIEILNTATEHTISPLVYPSWHPGGRFVAFSVNNTAQTFHATQRVEVFDKASDVVVYDIRERTILTASAISSKSQFETFPTFSPDGRTLYFCSGAACVTPDSLATLRYHLCSISFDAEAGTFGSAVDTLYDAEAEGQSVSFPRVSPDGKYLMCTLSSYGTFPIWHKDADLYLIDLATGEGRRLDTVNSDCADSYHSWSGNSRWVVFSSRRIDGLYTRPFFVYINEHGEAAKPFLLPQKHPAEFYASLMQSYNIPEFVAGKISNREYAIMRKAKDKKSLKRVKFDLR